MSHIYSFYIAPASVIPPILLGFRRFNKLNISCKFLIAYLISSLIASVLMRVFAYVYHSNKIVLKCYTIVEFPILAGFYYWQFSSPIMRQVTKGLIALFAILSISLFFTYYEDVPFDDYATSLESVLIIFLGTSLIFNDNSLISSSKPWAYYPKNWFNTGVLLHFCGSLFIFLLTNYTLVGDYAIYDFIWDIHATLFLGLNLLLSVGFLKIGNSSEQSEDLNI